MPLLANILILDDEDDTQDLFAQKFRNQVSDGTYTFSFAKRAEDAVQLLKNQNFDILITDINVDGMDGIEFIRQLRKDNPLMRTIVVSAYGDINTLRAIMRCGAHDFVIKPIDFKDLTGTIEKTVQVVINLKKMEQTTQKLSAISDELDVSAKLQKSILPGNIVKKGSIELWADTVPAAEVGGDFYDYFWLSEDKLGIVMADVSGKNISAAMFALIAKTLIKSFSKIYPSPAECFKNVNITLCAENVTTMFVTAMYGIVDMTKNELIYTNAGHLPIAVVSPGGEPFFLACEEGMALGIFEEVEFSDNVHKFSPGETIMMYTDGVNEAVSVAEEEYEFERMSKVLKESSTKSPKIMTEALVKSIKDFTGLAPQSDDITTLCLKYRLRVAPVVIETDSKKEGETAMPDMTEKSSIILKIKNNIEEIARVCDEVKVFCVNSHISDEKYHDIVLILDEVVTNVINYAYQEEQEEQTFQLHIIKENGVIDIKLIDDGVEFNPIDRDEPDTDSDLEERLIGGLGIFIVKQLSRSVSYARIDGKNHLQIEIAISEKDEEKNGSQE